MPSTGYTLAGADAVAMLSPTGEETVSRENVASSASLATGNLALSYFVARHTASVNTVITQTTGTAAGATPTIARIGVYSVATNGDITLIGSTANDTALWNATSTSFTKTFSAATPLVFGSTYAVGLLVVTAAAAPTIAAGPATLLSSVQALAPRMTGVVTGQSNLPSTVASGSIANTTFNPYARLVP